MPSHWNGLPALQIDTGVEIHRLLIRIFSLPQDIIAVQADNCRGGRDDSFLINRDLENRIRLGVG